MAVFGLARAFRANDHADGPIGGQRVRNHSTPLDLDLSALPVYVYV
jgi:hypothetical protein